MSVVTLNAVEADDAFPAASVDMAVSEWLPFANAEVVKVQESEPFAVVVPSEVIPSNISTVESASAEPLIVRVSSLVMLSDADAPLSSLKLVTNGTPGGVLSMA